MRLVSFKMAVLGLCVLSLIGSPAAAEPQPTQPTGLVWQADLYSAHKLAVRDGKPMLLVFGAEWCGWCKKLEKSTLGDPQMVRYINSTFVPVHIDVDEQKKVAEILEVETLPCTIVLSPDADLLGRLEGFDNPPGLYQKLAAAKKLQDRVSQTSARETR